MLKPIAICTVLTLTFLSPAAAQDVSATAETAKPATQASEVPQAVKDACKDDYERHCKKHDPDSAAGRDCMAAAFEKLSDPCVTAILDSPLVEEEQQRLANAQTGEPADADAASPKQKGDGAANSNKVAEHKHPSHNMHAAKPATRTAKARYAAPAKVAAIKSKRHVAQAGTAPRRGVAAHIRRGTGIANYYVTKYTRFAFAKAFR